MSATTDLWAILKGDGIALDEEEAAALGAPKGETISLWMAVQARHGSVLAHIFCLALWLVQYQHCTKQLAGVPMQVDNYIRAVVLLVAFWPIVKLLELLRRIAKVYTAFNTRLAGKLTNLILSMSMFWILTLGFILGLADPKFIPYFQAFSSNWYQGIALPIIGVSGTIAAMKTAAFIQETHDMVMEILRVIQVQQANHTEQINALHDKHDGLVERLGFGGNDTRV